MAQSNPPFDPLTEPDLSNRQLGDYLIGRRLGRGGMADVYLAEQQSLRRQVALKVLHRNLARDEVYVRRFHNEAQAAASLVHANIVQIYEVGCEEGIHFIAQEYVDGQNLKQLILRRGKLHVPKAVGIIRQVAAALHKAAQRGIVHRDIKPENILLSASGEVKVADFGLARITHDGRRVDLTQVGMTLGTPLYMSPEQIEGLSLDPRSDLYSFGVMCYEMLVGRPPFEGDNAFSVAIQHLKNDPPRLETLRDDLPGGLARIVHRLLAKKLEDRYPSAAEVLRDMRAIPIEGLGDWPAADEDWNTVEWENLATARMVATQQLATVMRRESRLASTWRWLAIPFLAIVLGLGTGAAAAWWLQPSYLLDLTTSEVPQTPRQATVKAQYDYAMTHGDERDFEAVAKYFPRQADPQNEEYIRKAQLQLAYFYSDNNRLNEALSTLEELASQDADANLKIRALVLQANVLGKLAGKERDAISRLAVLIDFMKATERTTERDRFQILRDIEKPRLRDEFQQLFQEKVRNADGASGRPPVPNRS